jgi:LTXXQ motif family protein
MWALLVAVPVAAQQATPQAPAPSDSAGAQEPGAGPRGALGEPGTGNNEGPESMGKMSGHGPVGTGMMDRPKTRGTDDEDDDDNRVGRMRPRSHVGGHRAPVQVIINIGPDNHVEVEEQEARGARIGPKREAMMTGSEAHSGAMASGVKTRLVYLRKELRLTPEQQPAWNRVANAVLAGAVRDAVARMHSSLDQTAEGQPPLERRLNAYEAVFTARLEAVRALRDALSELTRTLDEAQRRTLDEHADAFYLEMNQMQAGMR